MFFNHSRLVKTTVLALLLIISKIDFCYSAPILELNEFTERVLLVRTRAGETLHNSLVGHEVDRTFYVSANDFFEMLGFETRQISEFKEFEAKLKNPEIDFHLYLTDCSFELDDKKQKTSCQNILYFEEEFFLSRIFVESLLKMNITYLPYKSEIQIFTEESYPILEKLKRNKNAKKSSAKKTYDPGFPHQESDSQTLKNFYWDQQLSLHLKNRDKGEASYYSNLTSDVIDHEVQVTTQGTGDNNEFTTGLIRRDFYGSEKNKYISNYQIGTVVIPTAEIIGGPTGGEGVYLTNRDQNQLISFGQREIEGNLRPEWEVELYVNDILFSRQTANSLGRYRFTDVPVLYGTNIFRLEFYGPQGERRTEYLNSNITQKNLKSNELQYEAGATADSSRTEAQTQISYGLSDNFSTYFAYSRYNLGSETQARDYSVLGLNSLWDNFSGSLFYGEDFTEKGSFLAVRSQLTLNRNVLQLLYVDGNQFRSTNFSASGDFIDKTLQSDFSLSFLGFASMLYRVRHDVFENQRTANSALQFIVFSINSLSFQLKNDIVHGVDNEAQAIYTYFRNQFRLTTSYGLDGVNSAGLEYRKRFARDSSIYASYRRDYIDNQNIVEAGYQHRFNRFIAGLEGYSNGDLDHQVFLRLRTSFGYNSNGHNVRMSSDLLASRGNLCATVFLDDNNDGVFNRESEEALEDVEISWIQGNRIFKTDEDGEAFLTDLPLYQAADIQILHSSLKDPQLSFPQKGFRTYLQKGQCLELNFAMVRIHDIEGQIIKTNSNTPPRTTLILYNSQTKTEIKERSDRDGYFLFSNIPPGTYSLKVEEENSSFSPESYYIDTKNQDSLDQDFYFTIN